MTIPQDTPGEPVPLREAILELSNERDSWLGRLLGAWVDGWRACESHLGDRYEAGFADGVLAVKRAQHDAYTLTKLDVRRWGLGGRAHFSDPRPGDYPGGAA